MKGEMSIHHVLNMASKHGLQALSGISLATITKKGFNVMKDIGNWIQTEDRRYGFKVNELKK